MLEVGNAKDIRVRQEEVAIRVKTVLADQKERRQGPTRSKSERP